MCHRKVISDPYEKINYSSNKLVFGRKLKNPIATIGLGVPTTSRGFDSIDELALFDIFLPSFVRSIASCPSIQFSLYIAFDNNDPLLNFENIKNKLKPFDNDNVEYYLIQIPPFKIISLIWSFLYYLSMKDACNYFYQLNDDIEFLSTNWASDFIHQMRQMNDYGVVGPADILWNCKILTQVFVSPKHFDVFGFLYPFELHDWHSDSWITYVYSDRMKCLKKHPINNTNKKNTRYNPCEYSDWWKLVLKHRETIKKIPM